MGEQDPNDVPKPLSPPLDKKSAKTIETSAGIPLDEVYDEASLSGRTPPFEPARDLGRPGQFPYTRGIHASMYRGKPWTMRQYAGFGTAAESNRRYKFLLASGQTGLSVAFDLPTQMGRDADHPLARGEAGRAGVSISSIDDMHALLEGLPLETVSTSMTINATAATLLCLYVAVADERGIARDKLSGTIQNDILKEYIARGTYIYPPAASMRLCADSFAWCAGELPRWNTVSISGYHIREAGSDAVQEVAFTLADGIAYVEAARARRPAGRLRAAAVVLLQRPRPPAGRGGQFRAARRLWARIMRARFDAKDPRSLMLRFHAQTAGSTLTAVDPLNNVARTTIEALAAVLGGAQIDPHQRWLRRGAGAADRDLGGGRGCRTQQILAHESGAADVVDPLGGAYAIEALTSEIETRAEEALIAEIDRRGGMVRAIEAGFPQREIEGRALAHQRAVESGTRVIVGVNRLQPRRARGRPGAPQGPTRCSRPPGPPSWRPVAQHA